LLASLELDVAPASQRSTCGSEIERFVHRSCASTSSTSGPASSKSRQA